jgi:hypothetical protein
MTDDRIGRYSVSDRWRHDDDDDDPDEDDEDDDEDDDDLCSPSR